MDRQVIFLVGVIHSKVTCHFGSANEVENLKSVGKYEMKLHKSTVKEKTF